ncbi:endonuclease MutS2 [Halonotius aquaticus]|uniref:DNA-binding protein MutS2 n=1 Tax=Halonotius aquaticus TaxID=2216978 RepID=A0A3A6PS81_9EURY|nr:helix-hairpin-helix domain-containing protein [Halonotius aquaticus]RJX45239.1 endonuclease MutS2 [Halonotius aquaticus]
MAFESIPGVGEKTADALAELDDPETALQQGDVLTLMDAPGISEGRAAAIARGAIRQRHDDPGGLLATDQARELYDSVLELLQERAVTTYAKKRLETLYPATQGSRIEEVRATVDNALTREPTPELRAALADVAPLDTPSGLRVRERCLATTDAERYAAAREAIPELSAEVVDDGHDIEELARSYSTVIVLDEAFAGGDFSGDVRVQPDALESPEDVVPERLLAFFAENRETLLAAVRVHEASELEPPLDCDALTESLSRVDEDGTIVGDEELERLATAVDDLDAAVGTAESVANDHLRAAIKERDVTIEGQDFLSLVEQGARVDSLLARELDDAFDAALQKAHDHLTESLALTDHEAELAEHIFGGEPTFPVSRRDDAVSRLNTELTSARDRRSTKLKADLADDLAALKTPAEELVRNALELDVELAIAAFARDFDCTMPEFVGDAVDEDVADDGADDDGDTDSSEDAASTPGFVIEGGRSPILDVDFEAVEPVDYSVEGVTLLSGVNSGGKTSLLDLVGLIVIAAQMGLPVPAEAVQLSRFSELHYYAKSQGTLDAGAFESTLQDFGDLVAGADGRLVLVDELESITEPGASAKLIAGILEALDRQETAAVFVSHLAREIREAAAIDVAVDGIEAVGLVDGELEVNRSPVKEHLARSTPELIVEKLAADEDGDFYDSLLAKF